MKDDCLICRYDVDGMIKETKEQFSNPTFTRMLDGRTLEELYHIGRDAFYKSCDKHKAASVVITTYLRWLVALERNAGDGTHITSCKCDYCAACLTKHTDLWGVAGGGCATCPFDQLCDTLDSLDEELHYKYRIMPVMKDAMNIVVEECLRANLTVDQSLLQPPHVEIQLCV